MNRGTSIITTVFTSTVGDLTYEYEATQEAGKPAHTILFHVRRGSQYLVGGTNRPAEGYFSFETRSALLPEERTAINEQVNRDLSEVITETTNINITTTV